MNFTNLTHYVIVKETLNKNDPKRNTQRNDLEFRCVCVAQQEIVIHLPVTIYFNEISDLYSPILRLLKIYQNILLA